MVMQMICFGLVEDRVRFWPTKDGLVDGKTYIMSYAR